MRAFLTALLAALLLAACATVPGPRSITLTREDIERGIEADLGALLGPLRGLDLRRPEVALMPVAGRLQLVWNAALADDAGAAGAAYGLAIVLSGRPQLNAARNGIDLAQVQLDDVRVLGLPRVLGFGLARLADRKGAALPDLPLLGIAQQQLRAGDVAYEATGVAVTGRGLQIDLAPR